MFASYVLKKEDKFTNAIRYWDGKQWGSHEAKGYVSHGRAERVLRKLIRECKAFGDETVIEEYVR